MGAQKQWNFLLSDTHHVQLYHVWVHVCVCVFCVCVCLRTSVHVASSLHLCVPMTVVQILEAQTLLWNLNPLIHEMQSHSKDWVAR